MLSSSLPHHGPATDSHRVRRVDEGKGAATLIAEKIVVVVAVVVDNNLLYLLVVLVKMIAIPTISVKLTTIIMVVMMVMHYHLHFTYLFYIYHMVISACVPVLVWFPPYRRSVCQSVLLNVVF